MCLIERAIASYKTSDLNCVKFTCEKDCKICTYYHSALINTYVSASLLFASSCIKWIWFTSCTARQSRCRPPTQGLGSYRGGADLRFRGPRLRVQGHRYEASLLHNVPPVWPHSIATAACFVTALWRVSTDESTLGFLRVLNLQPSDLHANAVTTLLTIRISIRCIEFDKSAECYECLVRSSTSWKLLLLIRYCGRLLKKMTSSHLGYDCWEFGLWC